MIRNIAKQIKQVENADIFDGTKEQVAAHDDAESLVNEGNC